MNATLALDDAPAEDAPTVRVERPRPPSGLPPVRRILKWLAALLTVSVLAAVLWLLYQKTQSASPEARAAVESELRQLRQIDSDWNVDILRSKVGLNQDYDAVVSPLDRIRRAMGRLESRAGLGAAPVKAELDQVNVAFARKADAVDAFKSHHSVLRNSLRYLPTAAAEARQAIAPVPGAKRTPAEVAAQAELDGTVATVLGEALKYAVSADEGQRGLLNQATDHLAQLVEALPESAPGRSAVEVFLNHARTVLRRQATEDQLIADIAKVPTVSAIDRTGGAFDAHFNQQAQDTAFWRDALVGYSAFLLLLVIFIGWRLRQSYVEINRVNAALVSANDGLELRVQERTAELDNALRSLRESESQLIQSEKMSSLGQMIAGVAHEINTPLAYVRSSLETVGDRLGEVDQLVDGTRQMLELMAAPEPDPDQLSACYGTVSSVTQLFTEHGLVQEMRKLSVDGMHGIDQISEIVTSLRNFSRLDRSKTTLFDLREGLDSTLVIARNAVKHHEVARRYGDIPRIQCAPSQLNQVFLNLINNAAQALPADGGTITLATSVDGDTVRVDVMDNGKGIAPEHLGRIFDPFFTTKPIGEGTGLGLSIAYKIVQEHGGRIAVQSEPGRGTIFSVYLPIQAPQPATA